MNGLRRCNFCPPDDNMWPEESFTAAGSAYHHMCDACFEERWPVRWTECSGCGRVMKTRGRSEPMCRSCRRGDPPVSCKVCGEGPRGVQIYETKDGPRCGRCYARERWRKYHRRPRRRI